MKHERAGPPRFPSLITKNRSDRVLYSGVTSHPRTAVPGSAPSQNGKQQTSGANPGWRRAFSTSTWGKRPQQGDRCQYRQGQRQFQAETPPERRGGGVVVPHQHRGIPPPVEGGESQHPSEEEKLHQQQPPIIAGHQAGDVDAGYGPYIDEAGYDQEGDHDGADERETLQR